MKRNKFSLSNYKLLSCDMGELVPCGLLEVLPGDSIQHATSVLLRCSPLLSPVMHPVHVRVHHWFVPHRLVWEDFEDFITGGPDGMDASVFPTRTSGAEYAIGSLGDYLGYPTGVASFVASVLPFRGYSLIWNEWYRDQDLQAPVFVSTASGNDVGTNIVLQNVCWEKDYFTSSRPWEQKGPGITIPIGTTAPVTGIGWPGSPNIINNPSIARTAPGVTMAAGASVPVYNDGTPADLVIRADGSNPATASPLILTDLTNASAVTVNALREALALQRYEEARARYGSRYTEYLRYLGVRSSDARLQRPEYLGGGKKVIQFSEVLQTAEGTNPVGEMRGHGISALRSNRYRRFFEEHGYVFSLISVRPRTMYHQGVPRSFTRTVKEDFWQKELEHIGQQEVVNKEIYAAHASPDATFGYQDRYDEYRRQESTIAGEFRTTVLDHWHMARTFSSSPALNADFVKSVPTERTFAVPSEDVLYIMANHSVQARRMISQMGTSFIY